MAPDEVHFYLAAIAYEYHKDVQETLNFLESIPPENRFYDRALRLRIQLLHDQQRYEDAMQLILQGQSQFPTERDFRLMEIHLYLLQDRYKEALTAATAARRSGLRTTKSPMSTARAGFPRPQARGLAMMESHRRPQSRGLQALN